MRELRAGLWHWEAPHPEWTPEDGGPTGWPREVSAYALVTVAELVLIDPIAPGPALDQLAAGREVVVVLTVPFHERDSAEVVARTGAAVHRPHWGGPEPQIEGVDFGAGDELPGGIAAHSSFYAEDCPLWIPAQTALAVGDVLIDRGDGLEIPATWKPTRISLEDKRAALRPLLDLPVELVLPTHGPPADRAALERALA